MLPYVDLHGIGTKIICGGTSYEICDHTGVSIYAVNPSVFEWRTDHREPLGVVYQDHGIWCSQVFSTIETLRHEAKNGRSLETAVSSVLDPK
jgi:hypothetical protein